MARLVIIPIVTAIIERKFSEIKYIKNELHNQWMNDYLVLYIEINVTCNIDNKIII